jgi:membrane-associated phospholipid phosphatase
MQVRILLLLALLVSFYSSSAFAGRQPPPGPRDMEPPYLTQHGTHELPPRYQPPPGPGAMARLAYWNDVALRANAVDNTPSMAARDPRTAEQLGPVRSARAMAIVQIAVYDAVNAIAHRYPGYSGTLPAFSDSSVDVAIAQAAHDALVVLYPGQAPRIDAWLVADLARLPGGRAKLNGIDIGRRAAAAILALRANDGAQVDDPIVGIDHTVSPDPGHWRPDPVSRILVALGAYGGRIKPFVLHAVERYRPPPPPSLKSEAYARAFNEVKQFGGDGLTTPTLRTQEQTVVGIFWGYDGTAWVGSRPRLYNQITVQLALHRTSDALELARTLALVNVAIADASIAVWDAKYFYDFWRPVTAIREASPGVGPTGVGDGNPATAGDPGWTPLGAPASNLVGPNFTPPFPSYASGHASLGSAMFHMMRRLLGDRLPFTFVSDEFNGITRDNHGNVRPRLPRTYGSLSQAEEENGQSRIYLGIHWQFDKTAGMNMGRRVADEVFQRGLVQPAN